MATSVASLLTNESLARENEEEQSRINDTDTTDDAGEQDEYQGDKFNMSTLEARMKRPFSPCSTGTNPIIDKTECLSDKMVRLARRKAEIRAQRVEDPANPLRLKAYKDHRLRVKTAKPFVDSSNPMEGKIPYLNHNYNQRLMNTARVERENAIMLRHLAEIIHGRGTFDTRWANNTKFINHRDQNRQLRLLKITFENLTLLKRIQSQKPFYSRRGQLANYSRQEEIMEKMSLYPLFWQIGKECKWGSIGVKAKANAQQNPRPRCFLALGSSEQFYGKVTFELFAKECPMTAENFRGLCTGEYGFSYKCSSIHRIVKDILWQGGDVTGQGGSGSKSIFGDHFPDENFTFKHDKPGVLSMANSGPDTNGSQFMITAKRLSVLDGKNVVFGRVTGGMNVLQKLFSEVTSSGKPKKKIFIVECGELDVNEDTRTEEGDSEETEELDLEDSNEEANTSVSEPLTYDTEEEK